jgi:hypothetical protein
MLSTVTALHDLMVTNYPAGNFLNNSHTEASKRLRMHEEGSHKIMAMVFVSLQQALQYNNYQYLYSLANRYLL